MRVRSSLAFSILGAAVAALLFVPLAQAQDRTVDNMRDNIAPGDYLRFSVGVANPLGAQGNLRDWSSGTAYNLMWESWGAGGAGTDLTGYGFSVGYTQLPFNNSFFVQNFTPTQVTGSTATATAADARVLEFLATLRIRIPAPLVMPHLSLGLGFMNWHPGTIHYTTTTGATADAKQESRSGAEFSVGGGVDRHVYDRVGIFAEALYTYGFTNVGQGLATPTGTCAANGCDVLKNTTLGTIRGGLRVRIGQ